MPKRKLEQISKTVWLCATHKRARRKLASKQAHEARVQKLYGLEPGEYEKLYFFQGGHCWLCQLATGKSKRLAVDHDHTTGRPRGLLCSRCNHDVLGLIESCPDPRGYALRLLRYLYGVTPYELMKEQHDEV